MKRGPRKAGIFEVLSTALELEARVMRLYVEIGNRFRGRPKVREFWLRMARHEAGHCGALMLIQTVIESASTAPTSAVWFDRHTIVRLQTLLAAYLREVKRGVSLARACEMAVDIESSELEDLVSDLLGVVRDRAWRERAMAMLTHDMEDLAALVQNVCGQGALSERAKALAGRRTLRSPSAGRPSGGSKPQPSSKKRGRKGRPR